MNGLIKWRRMMGAKLRKDGRPITQHEAARLLEIGNGTWNRYETGVTEKVPRHILLAMAALLNGLPPLKPNG